MFVCLFWANFLTFSALQSGPLKSWPPACSIMFQSKDAIYSIKGFKAKERKKFPCEKCGIMFSGHKTLQNHKKARHCNRCQDAFVSPKVLVEHLLTKHGEVRVPRSRGRTASQTGPGPGDHSMAPNGPLTGPPLSVRATVSNPSRPDPMELSSASQG